MQPLYSYTNLGNYGRLGNQLWQLASTIGLAHRAGDMNAVSFPKDWRYRQYFNVPDEYFTNQYGSISNNAEDYLQNLDNFIDIKDYIRKILIPSELTMSELNAHPYFYDITMNPRHTIGLHLRRGDSVGKEIYHPILPWDYYLGAIIDRTRPLSLIENAQLIIFTDDMAYYRPRLTDIGVDDAIWVTPEYGAWIHGSNQHNPTDHVELFLLSLCDTQVIANSTYSWWAAFLSDKQDVYYPDPWYGPALQNIDWQAMIPDWWKRRTWQS